MSKRKQRQKNKKRKHKAPRRNIVNRKPGLTAAMADKHKLYELSVQNAEGSVEIIDDMFAARHNDRKAIRLREDFCGTAKLCASWVESDPERTALGIDLDRETLDWGREHNIGPLGEDSARVTLIEGDVLEENKEQVDVIAAFNFSYWVFHEREVLRRYFINAKKSLAEGGILVLDLHGGPDSQFAMEEETEYEGFSYVWDQESFDPINNRTVCHIHFKFPDGTSIKTAFTYDWRMWSLPELRDLLVEVGFKKVDVWWDGEDDIVRPETSVENLISWIAYITAEN
jgi:SAM-dependent methyltransferase